MLFFNLQHALLTRISTVMPALNVLRLHPSFSSLVNVRLSQTSSIYINTALCTFILSVYFCENVFETKGFFYNGPQVISGGFPFSDQSFKFNNE